MIIGPVFILTNYFVLVLANTMYDVIDGSSGTPAAFAKVHCKNCVKTVTDTVSEAIEHEKYSTQWNGKRDDDADTYKGPFDVTTVTNKYPKTTAWMFASGLTSWGALSVVTAIEHCTEAGYTKCDCVRKVSKAVVTSIFAVGGLYIAADESGWWGTTSTQEIRGLSMILLPIQHWAACTMSRVTQIIYQVVVYLAARLS